MCAVPYRCRWSIGKRNQIGLAWESDGSFDGLMVWGGGGEGEEMYLGYLRVQG